MHKILASCLLSLSLLSLHVQARDSLNESSSDEGYGTFSSDAGSAASHEAIQVGVGSGISGMGVYDALAPLPPKLTKADLHRFARPQEHAARAVGPMEADALVHSSVSGMTKLEGAEDPWYIKEERALIAGKTLTLTGVLIFRSYDLPGKMITGLTYTDIPHEVQKWSHAGLLLEDEHAQQYCFESTGSAGAIFSGMLPQVQIHTLEKAVKEYAGDVGLRRIIHDDTDPFRQDTGRATDLVWDWVGVSYERRPLELLKSIAGWNKYHADSEKSLFCSEMDALMLQQLGYLPYGPKSKPADNYLPRNFGASDTLSLLHGRLEDIEILKTYTQYQADNHQKGCCTIL